MKTLLVSANAERSIMPVLPLGLLCVAQSARRAGHETVLLDLMAEEKVAARPERVISRVRPQVIGFSIRNIDNQDMRNPGFLLNQSRDAVSICRSLIRAPVVVGGPGESPSTVEESVAFVDSLDLDLVKVTVGIRIYPRTKLAGLARLCGMISDEDSLLTPRFYLEPGLEGWVEEQVDALVAEREHWQR